MPDSPLVVDAYHDYCYGPLLLQHVRLLPRPSTRRRWGHSLRTAASVVIAASTVGAVVVVLPPITQAAATPSSHVAPPPNTVHHVKTIGHIRKVPASCPPTTPSPPTPAITTLAWVAESSLNEVQAIDEPTGALVGTPITVGTTPDGIGYWRPAASSHQDPDVVVANSANHSVTIIDAVTSSVLATVSIPSGSSAGAVATSPTNRFALVVDVSSGNVSIINLQTDADQGEISLTATANVLQSIAFSPSGAYAYVTDPSQHKIFVIDHTAGTSPYYATGTTYTNASYDFSGVASDLSTTSSGSFYATDAQASGYLLKFTVAATLSAPTTVARFNSPSMTPGAVSVAPGETAAWVAMTGSTKVDDVAMPSGSITSDTVNSSFTSVGPLGLSADGATVLSADTGSAKVQELDATSGSATNLTATDGTVSAIAPALAEPGSWDAYVIDGADVDVVNSATMSVTQTIADADGPAALTTSPDGKFVYVANQTTASVSVIETSLVGTGTNPVLTTFSIPKGSEPNTPTPDGIAMNPSATSLLVEDSANGAVEVVDMNAADTTQFETVVTRIGLSGSGISSSYSPFPMTVGPDGKFAYVPVVTGGTSDGVTELQLSSATTTGYTYLAKQLGLTQDANTLYGPSDVTVNPNGETAYVTGAETTGGHDVVFAFPIGTNGELSNGSGTVAPVTIGYSADQVTFSPEDDSAFATSTSSFEYSSVSEVSSSVTYNSSTLGMPGSIAVTPDGFDVAVGESAFCGSSTNALGLFDAGSGTNLATVILATDPGPVVFAPQSSPQTISPSELVGGASNPAEAAVASGMNDVVTSGTPSDAPGVTAGVDTATGAYSISVASMDVPDLGIGLDQTVSYDSARATVAGVFGKGWDYTYGITATQNAHNAATNPCAIIVTQEDGATVTFYPSAKGPFTTTCPTAGYEAPGWAQATMTFQASCNGTDACFVMTRGAMTKYYIDEVNGELVKIADLNGNAVTITWGSHTACSGATTGDPCQVTAADGIRTLTYSYLTGGTGVCPSWTATCVIVTDPLGRTVRYNLSSASQLGSIVLANGSGNAWTVFAYNGTSTNLLINWWDPQNNANHPSSTTYATDVTYTSGLVTQVTGPPVASVAPLSTTAITPTTTFTYANYDAATDTGTVLVANPDFNQSNYEPGASETLDTYADDQLVSSVTGYGPLPAYDNGSTPPVVPINPSVNAVPMRDGLNLMPSESMGALAGSTVPAIGTQGAQYDSDVTVTDYDAHGNALSSTDPSGDTSSSTYNGLDEATSSTDAMGNVTKNTYNATGQLLTTTNPPNSTGTVTTTSNYYNANGTLCASRDAIETSVHGALSSCVTAGSNATTYAYDSSGDQTLSTVTDTTTPSTVTSTTQSEFDADGNVCATLSPNGYALSGDRLTSCPIAGAPYATVVLAHDVYDNPTTATMSLTASGTDTYTTTYACTNLNGDVITSVGSLGVQPTCPDTATTTSEDTTFTTYDADGDPVQSIAPFAAAGAQGPTTTTQFDADQNGTLNLSSEGYAVWEANHSASIGDYESSSLISDQGNTVATAPQSDTNSSCVDYASSPCPDDSVTAFDNEGQVTAESSAGNGDGGSATPTTESMVTNPDSTNAGSIGEVAGGSSGVQETSQTTYNADQANTEQVNEHWTGSSWATDSATTTAYAADGAACWTASASISSPTCTSPPSGVATIDYTDLDGNVIAEVGPGGSGTIGESGYCNPLDAVSTASSINTAKLCAFTTYHAYEEGGQVTETIGPSISASTTGYVTPGSTTTYTYDASSNQTVEVNPAGNTVTSSYDSANRLIGVTYSDVGTTNCSVAGMSYDTCYSYNADGTRSQLVDSTGATNYVYDDAANLVSVTDSNGNTVTYGYNEFGQRNCISYLGFSSSYSCLSSGNPNNGTNTVNLGEVWYSYDSLGRMSSIADWNDDSFTYGYDCTGDVAWLAETPSSQAPSVSPCQGSGGVVPTGPTPVATGTTFAVTKYNYSSGGSGNLLTSQTTSAVTHGGSTSLLEFDSLTYSDGDALTSSTPTVNGASESANVYGYDNQQRVIAGPETSGSKTAYSYINSSGTQPFYSSNTTDQMGIDAMPEPGSAAQLGAEYQGNGELCWIGEVTSTIGSCGSPAATNYESISYNNSGDLVGTTAHTYGSTSALTWNVDAGEPMCINPNGVSCTGPSSSQPQTASFAYDADGLRTSESTWDSATSSIVTATSTWNTSTSSMLSDGSYDYLYGLSASVPVAQINPTDSVTCVLVTDSEGNVRGVVEASSGAAHPFELAAYTDYDSYGNPISGSGGSLNIGGLGVEVGSDPDSVSHFGFGGGYADATGYDYLLHRYFDPGIGAFISIDPEAKATGTPFSYANDDPANVVDPTGEKGIDYETTARQLSKKCDRGEIGDCLKHSIRSHKKDSNISGTLEWKSQELEFDGGEGVLTIQSVVDFSSLPANAKDSVKWSVDGSAEVDVGNTQVNFDSNGMALAVVGESDSPGMIYPCDHNVYKFCYNHKFGPKAIADGVTATVDFEATLTVTDEGGPQDPPCPGCDWASAQAGMAAVAALIPAAYVAGVTFDWVVLAESAGVAVLA